ncbi:MAG: tRNA (guanosine(46)-N7)-methyltransferase TrmB [Pseudomonadales bacterium]
MTRGQHRALDTLSPRFGLEPGDELIAPDQVFGRAAPLGLEIGFGMGQALLHWARACPNWNLLGAEVYQPGIGSLLLGLERERLEHVRVVERPAEDLLARNLPPDSLDEVRIFFPDPWPKKRHLKRRLIQPAFAQLLATRLKPDAVLWLATDWEPYAHWMLEVLDAVPCMRNDAGPGCFAGVSSGTEARPQTRFEARGIRLGHGVWDLRYVRNRASTPSR